MTNALLIPPDETCLYSALPEEVRTEIGNWLSALQQVGRPLAVAFHTLSKQMGVSESTFRRTYYGVRQEGWRYLVPEHIVRTDETKLPEDFIQFWHSIQMEFQRELTGKRAHKELLRRWNRGVEIPGYAMHPAADPKTGIPHGWSYAHLMRFKPAKAVRTAMRIGRAAAALDRPLVLTTRADLYVGSHFVFDDFIHDMFVCAFDSKRLGRPAEFHGIDLYSAHKFVRGAKITGDNPESGKGERLKESDFRALLVFALMGTGYSPRGTRLVVEHGTAAIRDDVECILHDHTQGTITVHRSGIVGDVQAFCGQYLGRGKGNFRFKASLESQGNLYHNAFSALPAQTGKDIDHRPEELHGLLRYNEQILRAATTLPAERAALLDAPALTPRQFQMLSDEIYDRLARDPEHGLEGWDDLFTFDATLRRMRRLSRLEVFSQAKGTLTPLSEHAAALIFHRDLMVERRVRRGTIEVHDSELSSDALLFDAHTLTEGETFATVLNPFLPDCLWLFDAKGGYLGRIARSYRVSRLDTDALHREMGRVAAMEKTVLSTAAKLGHERTKRELARRRHNLNVIAGAPVTPKEKQHDGELREFDRHADPSVLAEPEQPTSSADEGRDTFDPTALL